MTLKQFKAKTQWMDPNDTLYWYDSEGNRVEFEAIFELASFTGINVRGPPMDKEMRAVADKVRLAIENSNLGRQE